MDVRPLYGAATAQRIAEATPGEYRGWALARGVDIRDRQVGYTGRDILELALTTELTRVARIGEADAADVAERLATASSAEAGPALHRGASYVFVDIDAVRDRVTQGLLVEPPEALTPSRFLRPLPA